MEVPLGFLGPGEYDAEIFADGPDADKRATSLNMNKKRVKPGETLPVHLAPGGGAAIIFTPAR